MRRRAYIRELSTVGAAGSISALAGCSTEGESTGPEGQSDGSADATAAPSPEPSPEPSPSPSPSPSPEPDLQPPQIDYVSFAANWESGGDARSQAVNAVGEGAYAYLAFEYKAWSHGGTQAITAQYELFDDSGRRVDDGQRSGEFLIEGTGLASAEWALLVDFRGLSRGTHTAELIIRDDELEATSDTVVVEIDVTEPLGPNEANLASVDAPRRVGINEQFDHVLTFENIGDRDGSVVSSYSYRQEGSRRWYAFRGDVLATVPAGGENDWLGEQFYFGRAGTYTLQVDSLGATATWTIEVS